MGLSSRWEELLVLKAKPVLGMEDSPAMPMQEGSKRITSSVTEYRSQPLSTEKFVQENLGVV